MSKLNQNFLKGKMNKDLDERLIPKGEYRLAQNILIAQSEDDDVGALENIKGNSAAHLFTGSGVGWSSFQDSILNNQTDFFPREDSFGNKYPYQCIGYHADVLNNRVYWFVTNWTGGADVSTVSRDSNSLSTSQPKRAGKTSVCSILMCDLNEATSTFDGDDSLPPVHRLAAGFFLNFSKNHLITGVNIIDDLLFWTDNYNQPRKINVKKALASPKYYDTEEKISVAKFAPYEVIKLYNPNGRGHDVTLTNSPRVESDYLEESFVRFSYRYKYKDGEYSTIAPFTQIVFAPLNNGIISNDFLDKYGYEKIYQDTVVKSMVNHYNKIELRIPLYSPEKLGSPEQNSEGLDTWINHLDIEKIELLVKKSNENIVKIAHSIDVTSNFSSNINEQETINPDQSTQNSNAVEVFKIKPGPDSVFFRYAYRYVYKSEEPFKALPEAQITRVYDHVPIKAKAQEIVGNRIVYGNYLENHPLPVDSRGNTGINYVINSSNKGDLEFEDSFGFKQHLDVSYRYHSIKQRRNYQVGVVLSDKFGRQSTVILSSNVDHPFLSDTFRVKNSPASTGMSWSAFGNLDSIGKSLSITFLDNKVVQDKYTYKDNTTIDYNPTGWYSWRLVVKQKEQEYYNVYAVNPVENWNALTDAIDTSESGSSWLTLHGDNINKVPRIVSKDDANKIGSSNSEIKLFPRVIKDPNQTGDGYSVYSNFTETVKVLSIGSPKEQGLVNDDNVNYSFLGSNKQSNSIAELPTLNSNNTPVFKTTAIALLDAEVLEVGDDDLKYVILKNRNYYIKKGHYIDGLNIQDKIVVSLAQAEGGVINNTKVIRFVTDNSAIYNTYYNVKKDHYVFEPGVIGALRSVVTEVEVNTIGGATEDAYRELIVTLDRNTSLLVDGVTFKEFTTITNVLDEFSGILNYQKLELSFHQPNINANDILTFRSIQEEPMAISRGLSVFETEPFKSNLDIFYETSTSGLISDLNSESNIVVENPDNVRISNNIFYEDQSPQNGNAFIGTLLADSATGDITTVFQFSIISVESENLDAPDLQAAFFINGSFLYVNSAFVWNPQAGQENHNLFTLTIHAEELTGVNSPSAIGTVELELKNMAPTIANQFSDGDPPIGTPVDVGLSLEPDLTGTVIFECAVENGSGNPTLQNKHLNVVLDNPNPDVAGAGIIVTSLVQTVLIDTNHYALDDPGPNGINFGMLTHQINNGILTITATSQFHAGKALFGDDLFDVNSGGQYIGGNTLLDAADREVTVYLNDGGKGLFDEPTEWNLEGKTVLTKFIIQPHTLGNLLYRQYIYARALGEDGTVYNYTVVDPFNILVGPAASALYVGLGTEDTFPENIGLGNFNLLIGHRFWINSWENNPLAPPNQLWGDGSGRVIYPAALDNDENVIFRVAVVDQQGFIIQTTTYEG